MGEKKGTKGDEILRSAQNDRGEDEILRRAAPQNDKGKGAQNDKGKGAQNDKGKGAQKDKSSKKKKTQESKARMNPRERKFAERWLVHFNATKAATEAGYSQRSAASIGWELLRKPKIRDYIRARLRAQDSAYVADADEAMAFNTAVMRGEVKDAFGLDASLADRLKASDAIARRAAAADSAESVGVIVEYINMDEDDAR